MLRALAAAALLALAACHERPGTPPDPTPEGTDYDVRVIDTEILMVDGRRVKLSNVDAPALVPAARCWAEAVAAKEAIVFLQETAVSGRTAEVVPDGRQNLPGRIVGRVLIDGLDVGDALYNQGLAARPGSQPFRWCEPMSSQTDGAPPMDPVLALTR